MKIKQVLHLVICLALGLLFAIPASLMAGKKDKQEEPLVGSCEVPVLETVEGYPWELTKDNVTIKLLPTPIATRVQFERTLEQKVSLLQIGDTRKYKISEKPLGYAYFPDSLIFALHVVNNMSHVLRFNGAVVSIIADGKSLPFNTTSQDELLKAVLTPYASFDVNLVGPPVADIVKATTITFSLYDVITEVDAANNPTKRATFEWIFSNRVTTRRDTLFVKTYEQKMTPLDASKMSRFGFWVEGLSESNSNTGK